MQTLIRRTVRLALAGAAALAIAAGSAAAVAAVSAPIASSGGVVAMIGSEIPTLTLAMHNSGHNAVGSVVVGTTVHPYATLSGAFGAPTGKVWFSTFNNADCTPNYATITTLTMSDGSSDATDIAIKETSSKTRSFMVLYEGDSTYTAVKTCRKVTWFRAAPSISIKVHDADHDAVTSVPFTEIVHVYADVNGRVDTPTGQASVHAWNNATCEGTPFATLGGSLSADGDRHLAQPFDLDAPGALSFDVQYSGDSTYAARTSACFSVTGTKLTPKIDMDQHDAAHGAVGATVPLDTTVHVDGSVTGAFSSQPSNKVSVELYFDATCDVLKGNTIGLVSYFETDPGSFGSVVRDGPAVAAWRIHYLGDDFYKGGYGECRSVRWKADPVVTLTVHDADHDHVLTSPAKESLHFRVSVLGGFGEVTGEVAIRQYENQSCASPSAPVGKAMLGDGVLHKTGLDVVPSGAGSFSFRAFYKGDSKYAPAQSLCNVVSVSKAVPAATATPEPTPKPTAKPTAKPAAVPTPGPTLAPAVTADPEPTAASPGPSPTPAPASTTAAGASPAPAASAGPGPSSAPASTNAVAGGTDAATATVDPGAGAPLAPAAGPAGGSAESDGGLLWILLVGLLLLIVAATFGFAMGRQRRSSEAQA